MTALEQAQAELSDAMVPMPADYMDDLTPQAGLLLGFELAKFCLTMVTDAAASLGVPDGEEQPTISEVLNGVSAMVAGACHALVALGVLPQAAEDALEVGTGA